MPCTENGRAGTRFKPDLNANRHPDSLLRKFLNHKIKPRQSRERPLGLKILLCVKGASNRLGLVFQKFYMRPERPLLNRPTNHQVQGIIYKVNCLDLTFTQVGESECSRVFARPSMIQAAQETNQQLSSTLRLLTDHNIHPRDAQILERCVTNYYKRLFWNRGAQLWTAPPSTKGNRSLMLTYR